MWPTPTVNGDYNRKGLSANSGDGLATAVRKVGMIGTPQANMKVRSDEFVRMWPTPTTPAGHCSGRLDEWGGRQNPFRGTAEGGGQLNPDFVEWLMNFPKGWTEV